VFGLQNTYFSLNISPFMNALCHEGAAANHTYLVTYNLFFTAVSWKIDIWYM
jgi:hypothetical protein